VVHIGSLAGYKFAKQFQYVSGSDIEIQHKKKIKIIFPFNIFYNLNNKESEEKMLSSIPITVCKPSCILKG
jgi:hypothetical protein